MKAKRNQKRTRTAAMVTALTLVALMALATPALAFGGIGIELEEPTTKYPQVEEDQLIIVDVYLGELVTSFPQDDGDDGAIPDGGDWEMCPADDGPFMDGGDWEMVPDDPQYPEAGDDEGTPDDQQVPDDGTDEPGDVPDDSSESTPTHDVPEDEGDDTPSLPFTGGNTIGFALAGIFILLAGVLVLGRGLTARS